VARRVRRQDPNAGRATRKWVGGDQKPSRPPPFHRMLKDSARSPRSASVAMPQALLLLPAGDRSRLPAGPTRLRLIRRFPVRLSAAPGRSALARAIKHLEIRSRASRGHPPAAGHQRGRKPVELKKDGNGRRDHQGEHHTRGVNRPVPLAEMPRPCRVRMDFFRGSPTFLSYPERPIGQIRVAG
jgi:hypothetical protein